MNDRDIEDTRQPPDEPEAVYCDECGEEMEWYDNELRLCRNRYCPGSFIGIYKEMAELIVEKNDTIERLENRVKFLAHKVQALEFQRDEKGA